MKGEMDPIIHLLAEAGIDTDERRSVPSLRAGLRNNAPRGSSYHDFPPNLFDLPEKNKYAERLIRNAVPPDLIAILVPRFFEEHPGEF